MAAKTPPSASAPASDPVPAPVQDLAPAAAPAGEAVPAEAEEPAISIELDEACRRLSARTKAVEALNAFHADEVAAGHHFDTDEAFAARFAAFMARPVG